MYQLSILGIKYLVLCYHAFCRLYHSVSNDGPLPSKCFFNETRAIAFPIIPYLYLSPLSVLRS